MAQNKKEKLSVSFKKDKPETGRAAMLYFYEGSVIKLNKKVMGYISAPNYQKNGWNISIQIMKDEANTDNNPNCLWKWIYVDHKFETEAEAKQYVKDRIPDWNERFTFYYDED